MDWALQIFLINGPGHAVAMMRAGRTPET